MSVDPFAIAADLLDPPDSDDRVRADDDYPTPGAMAVALTGGAEQQWAHLELIDRELVDIAEGRNDRLIVALPPQYGKTSRIAKWGIAWWLRRNPDLRAVLAMYGQEPATEWGQAVRDLFTTYDLGPRVSLTSRAGKRFSFAGRRGGLRTVGIGGSLTGRPADRLVIDDPIKNWEQANSPAYLQMVWNWWLTVASVRLQPGGAVVVVATRWRHDDLTGKLLESEGDQRHGGRWRYLRLPAFAEPTEDEPDPLGREPGELLSPERFSVQHVREAQTRMGPFVFGALFQQNPKPAEGHMFPRKNWRHYVQAFDGEAQTTVWRCVDDPVRPDRVVIPAHCWRFVTVDLAGSLKTSADWTVVAAWAVAPTGELLVVDVERQRLAPEGHWPLVETVARRTGAGFIAVESRMLGHDLVQAAGLAGVTLRELKADTDKLTRAIPAAARAAAGNLWVPLDAPWREEWEREHEQFPSGRHDDQVDTTSYAALQLVVGGSGVAGVAVPTGLVPTGGSPLARGTSSITGTFNRG